MRYKKYLFLYGTMNTLKNKSNNTINILTIIRNFSLEFNIILQSSYSLIQFKRALYNLSSN